MIRASLTAPEGITFLRKQIAEQLRDYSSKLQAEITERRERLARTEDKIVGLVGFIAGGDSSRYVVETLHDLEPHAKAEKREIARLLDDAKKPLRLPSIEEITESVKNFEARFAQDVAAGRAQLKRWLKDETIRIAWTEDGQWYPKGALLPLAIFAENEKHLGAFGAEVSTRCSGGTPNTSSRWISLDFVGMRHLFLTK